MAQSVLLGRGNELMPVPWSRWVRHLDDVPEHNQRRLAFMSRDHHRVRYFVVRELPRAGTVLSPEFIAEALDLPLARVQTILDDLERNLLFLWRGQAGTVSWAYPVTVDCTPHLIQFSSGERLYGAGAEDALATPFVQGRLREGEGLTFDIHSECAHCQRPLRFEMDGALNYQLADPDARPLVFSPDVDWSQFEEPNIIHAYGSNSLFFWSEEHAREYRQQNDQVDGTYFTLEQAGLMIPATQGPLFAFDGDPLCQSWGRPSAF